MTDSVERELCRFVMDFNWRFADEAAFSGMAAMAEDFLRRKKDVVFPIVQADTKKYGDELAQKSSSFEEYAVKSAASGNDVSGMPMHEYAARKAGLRNDGAYIWARWKDERGADHFCDFMVNA